ncbi:MAG: TetR/AcrR family transcriptional regulator [Verrucomicrobium sp.]|nr:TetR/AcrR family transcriptional regulator [Verrucomicrobium sp.]
MKTLLAPQANRITDCTQALIAAGGYNGFSYADISAHVGITKASIHHHFPKKADLVLTLVRRYRTAATEGMAALAAKDTGPLGCLEAYLGWWAACIGDGSMPLCICAMLAAEAPTLPAEVAEEVRLHFAGLAGWLESVLASGAACGALHLQTSPAAEAQLLMATVHGAMISARAYGDPKIFRTATNALLERLVLPSSPKNNRPAAAGKPVRP